MSNTTSAVDAIDGIESTWVLISGCLTLIMTPGAAYAYGGLRKKKHVLTITMQCFVSMAITSLTWVVVGFSLAFGSSIGGFVGNPTEFVFFNGVGVAPDPLIAKRVPLVVFAFFNMVFAVITPALVSGAWDGRVNFYVFGFWLVPWILLIYCLVVHWVWHPSGWMAQWGVVDWAGGTAVHITSGWSALVSQVFLDTLDSVKQKWRLSADNDARVGPPALDGGDEEDDDDNDDEAAEEADDEEEDLDEEEGVVSPSSTKRTTATSAESEAANNEVASSTAGGTAEATKRCCSPTGRTQQHDSSAPRWLRVVAERVEKGAKGGHNVLHVVLGTALLWFGWCGFNGGSSFHSIGTAGVAVLNTYLGAAAGLIAWSVTDMMMQLVIHRIIAPRSWSSVGIKFSITESMCGVLAGLVCVTPGAGVMATHAAVLCGVFAGVLCCLLSKILICRDLADGGANVFAIHGGGGCIGMFCTGFFLNDEQLLDAAGGRSLLIIKQIVAAVVVICWTSAMCVIIFGCLSITDLLRHFWLRGDAYEMLDIVTLRVPLHVEESGLDRTIHGEEAYNYLESSEPVGHADSSSGMSAKEAIEATRLARIMRNEAAAERLRRHNILPLSSSAVKPHAAAEEGGGGAEGESSSSGIMGVFSIGGSNINTTTNPRASSGRTMVFMETPGDFEDSRFEASETSSGGSGSSEERRRADKERAADVLHHRRVDGLASLRGERDRDRDVHEDSNFSETSDFLEFGHMNSGGGGGGGGGAPSFGSFGSLESSCAEPPDLSEDAAAGAQGLHIGEERMVRSQPAYNPY